MLRRIWWIPLVVAALLLFTTTSVLAQSGTGDQVVVGQNYTLRSGQQLAGNLTVLGGNVTLEEGSTVEGDALMVGGNMVASGTIRGNLKVMGGSVTLAGSSVVQGDLATFGGAVRRAAGSKVGGQVVEGFGNGTPPVHLLPGLPGDQRVLSVSSNHGGPFQAFGNLLRWQVTTIGLGLLIALLALAALLIAPRQVERVANAAAHEPALSFGVGLLTLVVALLAGTLLIIACGLGLLILMALGLAMLVGWVAIGLWAGQRIFRALRVQTTSSLLEAAVGVFLLTVLARLPFCVGWAFGIVAGSIGLGAVVLTRFGSESYRRRAAAPVAPVPSSGVLPAQASAVRDVETPGRDSRLLNEPVDRPDQGESGPDQTPSDGGSI